jgi:uncharacterized protein (TIGR01777 family)
MRVIITGGTGLIGRALAVDLLKDSHEVIALSRRPERATGLPTGMRVERWDARTAEGWGPLVNGADAIVNLAGATIAGLWTAGRKRSIRDSRLNAGRAVVEAIQRASKKPRVVIQSSGVGYYGPRGDELITEESTSGDDFLGKLAVEWEASTAPVESLGVRRAIIRSGAVLSTKGGALPPLLLQYRLFVGGPLGDGRQWLPWIYIVDEVRAIRFLIDNESASGPFNLVAPNPLTNADFGRVLARVLRRPFLIPVPALALRLLAGEMSTILLDGQRAVPRRLQDAGFTFQFPEAEMALRDLLRQGKAPVQESLRMQVDLNE